MLKRFSKKCLLICCGRTDISLSEDEDQPARDHPSLFMPPSGELIQLENDIAFRKGKVLYTKGITEISQGLTVQGQLITVKSLKLSNTNEVHTICNVLKRLINATKSWEHLNLVKYLGADFDPSTSEFFIFTEYVASEYDLIIKMIKEEQHIQFFSYQILKALKFLNDKGIKKVGNIKPSNLLMETGGIIKLRDYVGNDYFRILRKISGDKKDDDNSTSLTNDLQEIRKLIMDITYKIKVSRECIQFVQLLDQLSTKEEINFEVLFSHPFMQIRDLNLSLPDPKKALGGPSYQNYHTSNEQNILYNHSLNDIQNDPYSSQFNNLRGTQKNIAAMWKDVSREEQSFKNIVDEPRARSQRVDTKSSPPTPSQNRRVSPYPIDSKDIGVRNNTSASNKSLNPQVKNLAEYQNDLLLKMQMDLERNSSGEDLNYRTARKSKSRYNSQSSESMPKKTEESYLELLKIITQQNDYIKYLEREIKDIRKRSNSNIENNSNLQGNFNTSLMDRNIINNNIIINNIGKQINNKKIRSIINQNMGRNVRNQYNESNGTENESFANQNQNTPRNKDQKKRKNYMRSSSSNNQTNSEVYQKEYSTPKKGSRENFNKKQSVVLVSEDAASEYIDQEHSMNDDSKIGDSDFQINLRTKQPSLPQPPQQLPKQISSEVKHNFKRKSKYEKIREKEEYSEVSEKAEPEVIDKYNWVEKRPSHDKIKPIATKTIAIYDSRGRELAQQSQTSRTNQSPFKYHTFTPNQHQINEEFENPESINDTYKSDEDYGNTYIHELNLKEHDDSMHRNDISDSIKVSEQSSYFQQ